MFGSSSGALRTFSRLCSIVTKPPLTLWKASSYSRVVQRYCSSRLGIETPSATSAAPWHPRFTHHLSSCFDGLVGTEHPFRTVYGAHGDVRVWGSHHHGRLESVLRNRSQRFQALYS